MSITFRSYDHAKDYILVSDFLIAHHRPGTSTVIGSSPCGSTCTSTQRWTVHPLEGSVSGKRWERSSASYIVNGNWERRSFNSILRTGICERRCSSTRKPI